MNQRSTLFKDLKREHFPLSLLLVLAFAINLLLPAAVLASTPHDGEVLSQSLCLTASSRDGAEDTPIHGLQTCDCGLACHHGSLTVLAPYPADSIDLAGPNTGSTLTAFYRLTPPAPFHVLIKAIRAPPLG